MPRPATRPRHDRTEKYRHRAGILGVTLQRDHEVVAVDDPGCRRQKSAGAQQVWFQGDCLGGGQDAHALDAVDLRSLLDAGQHRVFLRIGRHDQLAAIDVGHTFLGAVGVKLAAAGDAKSSHQAVGGVVDAGMNDLAVARGGFSADRLRRFQDDDFTPRYGQRARHREAHDAGTHHDAIDLLHASFS